MSHVHTCSRRSYVRTKSESEIKTNNKKGKKLRLIPIQKSKKLQNLISRPEAIKGDPDDIADISWEKEVNLDLP